LFITTKININLILNIYTLLNDVQQQSANKDPLARVLTTIT